MKSAEDVAEYLANLGNLHEGEYFTDRVNIISSALNAFADERVREYGYGNYGTVQSLGYDREKLHQDMTDLLLTCAKGDVDGHFDLNWFLDSIDDQIRLIAKSVERKARAEAFEEMATMIEKRKGIPEHHSDIAELVRALKDAK